MAPQTSGPYGIRRLALQVELHDGVVMTFYADQQQAAAAQVVVETETETRQGFWHPLGNTRQPNTVTQIRVEDLTGYIMTMHRPDPAAPDELAPRKEIEQ